MNKPHAEREKLAPFFDIIRSGSGFIGWKAHAGHYQQEPFETIDQALKLIAAHRHQANIWCSMAAFVPGTSRDAVNAISLKAFWLDVDAHGKGPYQTPGEAINGLKSFVREGDLPKPNFIQMTGHGVQAYWVLDEPISKATWQPVADDLQELAKRSRLGADPITADAARILRVPATYNFRDPDDPVETFLHPVQPGYTDFASFEAAIKAALSKLPLPPPKPTNSLPTGIEDTPQNVALVEAMLAAMDPDCDYDSWRNICWAVAASGLSVDEDLARAWSATGVSWNENAFDTVWNSYDADHEKAVGFGTLVHHAREAGYTGPIPQAPEQFEKLVFRQSHQSPPVSTITAKGLVTQRASDIEPERVEWLIEGAIPMGMLVVIGGQPGMGKSQIAIKLAAAVTTGEGLPDV